MSSIKKTIEGHGIRELNGARSGEWVDVVAFVFVFQKTVRVCRGRLGTEC